MSERADRPVESTHAAARKRSGHILVVDDDQEIRSLAERVLTVSGYRVTLARDGLEATEMLSRDADQFDLVLLDLTMPRMSGEEAYRKLRQLRADLPVVLSSGYARSEAIEAMNKSDATVFLRKPYRPSQLLQLLQRTLPR